MKMTLKKKFVLEVRLEVMWKLNPLERVPTVYLYSLDGKSGRH